MRSPRPTEKDVPEGWVLLRDGVSKIGDMYWSYGTREWKKVSSRQTFAANNVAASMTSFIRKKEKP